MTRYLNDLQGWRLLALALHDYNVKAGWWDEWINDKRKRHRTAIALCISEVSEALEGARKGLMDDHLPMHPMFNVELADTAIRLLDLIGSRPYYHEQLDERLLEYVPDALNAIQREQLALAEQCHLIMSATFMQGAQGHPVYALACTVAVAEHNAINLMPLINEKWNYNRKRADHKMEARNAKHGKAF